MKLNVGGNIFNWSHVFNFLKPSSHQRYNDHNHNHKLKHNALCRLCLSGNVQKHNHKRPYNQHNHNHKKMIDHFLMIMIMSVTMTMLLVLQWEHENHNDIIRNIMAQLGHCVLANEILDPVLSGRFISRWRPASRKSLRVQLKTVPTRTEEAYVYVQDYDYACDLYVASGN